ncbi:hypothetical protein [Virgibacillus salexigens]|uniref:Uncharacterized protein n=1 Tax=Virgibacillus massiliensis TaxID=1462526 RepID=A0A024QI06_9BACI|nr:hypothetical protein [Virgibacillus massiliensis]CDQ41830.1 hypothetical protein BN990_04207 [Virgibacillus massiliensis]
MNKHKTWYGDIGIDTNYERHLISYRPNMQYPDKESKFPLGSDTVNKIDRSQDFLITRAIIDYQQLIDRMNSLLEVIKNRQNKEQFNDYLILLEERELEKAFQVEDTYCGFDGTADLEIYSMLFYMKASLEKQVTFIDNHYRTQITSETETEKVIKAEKDSISTWILSEYKLLEAYENQMHGELDEIEKEIEELEKQRRNLDTFHTSLGDIAYVHRNRAIQFETIIEGAEEIIHNPQELIDGNVEMLIRQLADLKNVQALKSHLILSFKEMKSVHNSIKQQYMMIDDKKEAFTSQRNYFYQQIVNKANNDLKDWLYEQPEESGKSTDRIADILVNSIQKTRKDYNESVTDMINIYKNESVFYGRQLSAIQKKEEIRLFYRIVEDLEGTNDVSDNWIAEYARTNGYSLSAV